MSLRSLARKLGCMCLGSRLSGLLYVGVWFGWFYSETTLGQINPLITIERDVPYGAVGERTLVLDIVRPKQEPKEPMPVVVFIHGGGWAGGNKQAGLPLLPPLAEKGYFCVSVGYRLSGEAPWPAQIHDCKAAIRWLRANAKKYNINPDKIGVWGASAGGHLALMVGLSADQKDLEGQSGSPDQSSRVACVVNWFGPTELLAAWNDPTLPQMVKDVLNKLVGGHAEQKLHVLKAASPLTYVSKDDPPVLTLHGTKDPIVPFSQATLLHEAMKKAGCVSYLVPVENAGHGFGGPEIFHRVHAFLDKYLRDQPGDISQEPIRLPEKPKPQPQTKQAA
ncbi:MAG: alpha/beta hydrolase [Thermoguttaceae bacterium]|nr:alpha/beta hydrolase [Thermoguttaceae bacterium]MDW8036688.1 alpha/beta hydrolase [Thermoguttaceae bacterium]